MTNSPSLWPQWLTGFIVCLATVNTGLTNGWTSPYLAQLTSSDTDTNLPLKLTDSEASWVASLLSLGRFIGAIVGAIAQGMIGRKKTLLVAMLPMAFGWTCTIIGSSLVNLLYIARFFCGLGAAMVWTSLSLYLGEIADASIRGSLIFLSANAAMVGSLMGTSMGPYLPMEHFGYVSLAIIVVFIGLFSLIPETPYHYVLKGNLEHAETSLRWFTRQPDVTKEIQELKNFVGSTNVSLLIRLREFTTTKNLKNTLFLMLLNIFLFAGGHNTMSFYAEIIVTKSGVSITPSTVVIAMSLCIVIAGASATIFVDRFGRRSLLIASSLGASLALILLGIHFHLLSLNFEATKLTWLPIFALFLYNFAINYGMIPVPNALMSELFPPIVKTLASMLFSASFALLSFIMTRTFQLLLNVMDEKYVFWMFAVGVFITAPFTYFCIPETKGKTLIEIQKCVSDCSAKKSTDLEAK